MTGLVLRFVFAVVADVTIVLYAAMYAMLALPELTELTSRAVSLLMDIGRALLAHW